MICTVQTFSISKRKTGLEDVDDQCINLDSDIKDYLDDMELEVPGNIEESTIDGKNG